MLFPQTVAIPFILNLESNRTSGTGLDDNVLSITTICLTCDTTMDNERIDRMTGMYIHGIDYCEHFKVPDYFVDGMNRNCGKSTPQKSTILSDQILSGDMISGLMLEH
jgi:hypothetical protein